MNRETLSNRSSKYFTFQTYDTRSRTYRICLLRVTVTDVNDNPPKMDVPPTCVTISEFHDIKDLIFAVKVKDADDPKTPNGRAKIRILFGNELGLFMLEQTDYWTANIRAAHSLRGKFGNYSLHLEARDLGSPSNKDAAVLHICVTDYNDNPPLFISPQHNTTIRIPEVNCASIIDK